MDVTARGGNAHLFDSPSAASAETPSASRRYTESSWTRDTVEYHKLDVLRSDQFNRVAKANVIVGLFCVFYVFLAVILSNTAFAHRANYTYRDGSILKNVRAFKLNRIWIGFEIGTALVCSLGMLCLTIVYPFRILYNNNFPVSQEQVWVLVLLATNALTMNPVVAVVQLQEYALDPAHAWYAQENVMCVVKYMYQARLLGSTITDLFYIWATATTYSPEHKLTNWKSYLRFYLPKIIPLLIYQSVRFSAREFGNIPASLIPFSTFFVMLANSIVMKNWFRNQVIYVVVITSFELAFLICIVRRIRITNHALAKCDYLQHRSKQLGFRFFLATMCVYFVEMILLDLFVSCAVPRYWNIGWLNRPPFIHFYHNNLMGGYVYDYLNFPLQFITAYAFLPPDSHGFRGWFGPSRRISKDGCDDVIVEEPLSLSTEELKSKRGRNCGGGRASSENSDHSNNLFEARLHANSLCLPTHIKLLNFAWLAYDWKKFAKEVFSWMDEADYSIHKHIQHSATDTELFIVSAKDRIIITFKGTDSMQNLWTDVNVVRSPLSSVLPTYTSATHEMRRTMEWAKASVHRGFLEGYRSVARQIVDCVERLLISSPRPILLTGHSLGGGLATICSLDLRACLGIPETDILVSTFGSPRVGNQFWSRLYDRFLPMHWRFTVQGDAVPWHPKLGYKHVGKRVLLTQKGNLFLDPNSLEAVLWQNEVPNPLHHKKQSYLRCLTTFCNKFTELKPKFYGHELESEESVSQLLTRMRSLKTSRGNLSSRGEGLRAM